MFLSLLETLVGFKVWLQYSELHAVIKFGVNDGSGDDGSFKVEVRIDEYTEVHEFDNSNIQIELTFGQRKLPVHPKQNQDCKQSV